MEHENESVGMDDETQAVSEICPKGEDTPELVHLVESKKRVVSQV